MTLVLEPPRCEVLLIVVAQMPSLLQRKRCNVTPEDFELGIVP